MAARDLREIGNPRAYLRTVFLATSAALERGMIWIVIARQV
jgi:hypothetical protein